MWWSWLAAEITRPETDVEKRGRSGKEQGGNDPEDTLQGQLPLPVLRVGNTRRWGIEMIQWDYKNILSYHVPFHCVLSSDRLCCVNSSTATDYKIDLGDVS